MSCNTCPFALTAESEQVRNLGCLPTSFEILEIKRKTNKNWACHGDESKICAGYVEVAKELGMDYKSGELATYSEWWNNAFL